MILTFASHFEMRGYPDCSILHGQRIHANLVVSIMVHVILMIRSSKRFMRMAGEGWGADVDWMCMADFYL